MYISNNRNPLQILHQSSIINPRTFLPRAQLNIENSVNRESGAGKHASSYMIENIVLSHDVHVFWHFAAKLETVQHNDLVKCVWDLTSSVDSSPLTEDRRSKGMREGSTST